MAERLGVRADPVGTPWGVSALIVGGARIRADRRLRSEVHRLATPPAAAACPGTVVPTGYAELP